MATNGQDEIAQIEKLKDSENFSIWKFQVTILFKSLGLRDRNWKFSFKRGCNR